jgi:hypothetical protein
MAKNQITSTSTSSNIPMPTAAEMKRFDDSYAKLQTLFQWKDDAETDLLTACEKEMARRNRFGSHQCSLRDEAIVDV